MFASLISGVLGYFSLLDYLDFESFLINQFKLLKNALYLKSKTCIKDVAFALEYISLRSQNQIYSYMNLYSLMLL